MTCRVKQGIGAFFIMLVALGFGVGQAWAGSGSCNPCTVQIDDLTDTVTVTGLAPGGDTFPIPLLPDSIGEFVHFTLPKPSSASISAFGDLLEADGTLSDRLLVTGTVGSFVLDVKFASDPASLMLPPGSVLSTRLTEDGTFQTLFTTSFPLGFGDFSFQVRSDVGDRTDVPEPATTLLLAVSGRAGLGGIAWRRRGRLASHAGVASPHPRQCTSRCSSRFRAADVF